MIYYTEVIKELVNRFPELINDNIINQDDHPMMIIGDFVFGVLIVAIKKEDSLKVEQAARFVNDLTLNVDDNEIMQLIDEIAIGLVGESPAYYSYFRSFLSEHAQKCLDRVVNLWNQQYK